MAYLDVRQPGSPVGSLRNFGMRCERDHGFPCNEVENEEDDSEVSHQSVHSRVTHLVEDGQFHLFDRDLESEDPSGSCKLGGAPCILPELTQAIQLFKLSALGTIRLNYQHF
ncbi:hypothetical protein KC19_3G079200 [Ceratodon purpureus]|uniref:Uncharacterized protein n=1 Tax=Ceratodon purpureus TaxID=3225 RepID=A0A8T0IG51_CERPU|nr:hypothetical protein KC19_3G079200 [Ceratodon purpureus]